MENSPRVMVCRRLPVATEARMRDLFHVTLNETDQPLARQQILAQLAGHDVLVSSITDRLDRDLISQFPQSVKLIAQFGNGVDNIDIDAARDRGITVTNTPSVLTEDTADMAMALILAVPRRLVEGARDLIGNPDWPGWAPTWMLGRRLATKKLGIVGMGRIGTAVARRAHAFGLEINYFSRTRRHPEIEEPLQATNWADLDAMLEAVDIVSLHTPLTNETFNLINEDRLKRMRRDAFLVNVSRSELIDEEALIALVKSGHLSGAGLDVFERKGAISKQLLALADANRIVLTPHMGSATLEGRLEMGEIVIVNIRVFFDGHKPPHRVLPDRQSQKTRK